jgi:hypothetical protein
LLAESFASGNAHKIEGVSTGEISKFKCTITENAKVKTSKFKGNGNTDLMAFQ